MNINSDKVLLSKITKSNRGHRILSRLSEEFMASDTYYSKNNNSEFFYKNPKIKCDQNFVKLHNFKNLKDLLESNLYSINQAQLNNSFSWIYPYEFFNNDIHIYINSKKFEDSFKIKNVILKLMSFDKDKNIFIPQIFNPPVLPDINDAEAKPVTLAKISSDYLIHLYNQEKLFREYIEGLIR